MRCWRKMVAALVLVLFLLAFSFPVSQYVHASSDGQAYKLCLSEAFAESLGDFGYSSFLDILAPPSITGVNPNSGKQGQTLDVVITGTNLDGVPDFGAGITFNSINGTSTQITANINIDTDAATGARDVSVNALGGTATLTGGFTVIQAAPTVNSINPNKCCQGDTVSVTITGTNFTGATAVDFGSGIIVNSFTVDSPTQITGSITTADTAATGARDVSVTTPGGTGTLPSGFTVEEKNGGLFDCACGSKVATASTSDILIGWGIIGLCWGTTYYLVGRVSQQRRK